MLNLLILASIGTFFRFLGVTFGLGTQASTHSHAFHNLLLSKGSTIRMEIEPELGLNYAKETTVRSFYDGRAENALY